MMHDSNAVFKPVQPVEGRPKWFINHSAAKGDIMRGAQNSADATGQVQEIWMDFDLVPPDVLDCRMAAMEMWFQARGLSVSRNYCLVATVERNPVRAEAGL